MSVIERVEGSAHTVVRSFHPLVAPVAVAIAAAAAASYVYAADPHEAGHYPTCPSLWLTGLYCPGCGSLRAIHDTLHLDFVGAWGMNPLTLLVLPWLAWRWTAWVLAAMGRPVRRPPAPAWALYALFAAVCLFAVLRNVPALAPYLAP